MSAGTSPENVLSSVYLSRLMLASVPRSVPQQLRVPLDAIALAACSVLIALDFELVAVGEAPPLDEPSISKAPRPLPSDWNSDWDANKRFFLFRDSDSRERFELHVLSTEPETVMITGITVDQHEKKEKFRSIVEWNEFISEENLPLNLKAKGDAEDDRKKVEAVFLTNGRLSDFGKQVRMEIVQKLRSAQRKRTSSSAKDEEKEKTQAAKSGEKQQREEKDREAIPSFDRAAPHPPPNLLDRLDPPAAIPNWYNDPIHPNPRNRFPSGDVQPPDFDDEHGLQAGNRGPHPTMIRPIPRPGYGDRDLNPDFGGGLGGFGQPPGFMGGSGGMFMPGPGQGSSSSSRPGIRHDPVHPMFDEDPMGRGMDGWRAGGGGGGGEGPGSFGFGAGGRGHGRGGFGMDGNGPPGFGGPGGGFGGFM